VDVSEPQRRIFISYAREDEDVAKHLSQLCERAGMDTWHDASDIKPGTSWLHQIEDAVRKCDMFLLLLSNSSLRSSEWVSAEWSLICQRHWEDPTVRLVPILLNSVQLPAFLRDSQALDVRDSSGLENCVKAIQRMSLLPQTHSSGFRADKRLQDELNVRFKTLLASLEATKRSGASEDQEASKE
jgi:hypothetical protein